MLLRAPGIFPDSSLHVSYVEGDKLLKGHAQICHLLLQEAAFPLQCLPFRGKAMFQLLLPLSGPILVVKGYIPGSFLLILIRWHPIPPYC